MKMLAMLRKKSAAPRGHSAAKSGRRGDLRLASSAGFQVAERIGEMLDRGLNDALEKHAIVAHLLIDLGGVACARAMCVVVCPPIVTNGWDGEFAELVPIEALLARQARGSRFHSSR